MFVGTRFGNKVTAVVKKDGKTELKTVASGLYRPNGLAYHNGTLYIAELSQISKIDNVEDILDHPPTPTVIYKDLPKDEAHGWKFIGIGPDNKLYIPVGQPGNNVLHDKDHGQIRRINLDGTGRETVALGVRNSVGFDWNPINNSSTSPTTAATGCRKTCRRTSSTASPRSGQDFGAPYCYQGNLPDPEFGWGHSCSEFVPPIAADRPALGRRSACASIPATCSRRSTRTPSSSPATARGTGPKIRRRHPRRPSQQGRQREVVGAVPHRLHRRTTIMSAVRWTWRS